MNTQQVVHPRPSGNGYGRQRMDQNMGVRTRKPASSNFTNAGSANSDKIGRTVGPSRDRVVYVMSHLRGQHVEVHLKNGSVISGIFFGANTEKDCGIILKMAQVVKDSSHRVQKPAQDTVKKPQTMIIQVKDLFQVIAKDISLTSDDFTNAQCEGRKDLLVDAAISQFHRPDLTRELEPWVPDKDDLECGDLEKTFDRTSYRSWDQFETNKKLFGVESTFDEDLYTTKLERGPHMREIEREAMRIAREIEGEETHDLHLAEERGIWLNHDLNLDDESRYSAVHRDVDGNLGKSYSDAFNDETFGASDGEASNQLQPDLDTHLSGSNDYLDESTSDHFSQSVAMDDEIRSDKKHAKDLGYIMNPLDENIENAASGDSQLSKFEPVESATTLRGLSPSATSYDPHGHENESSSSASLESAVPAKTSVASDSVNPFLQPVRSTRSPSVSAAAVPASTGSGLSPSSSVASLSSEKSTLNPHAKEFKFNPNAKSFTPAPSVRANTPTPEGSFYYSNNVPSVPHAHNLPVGVGFGPPFGPQHVYSQQGAQLQSPQAYMPPNTPVYGQQMIMGQPRPMFYMQPYPPYQPEMPYRGRNQ